ncbi:MAG: hypothetical protein ACPLQO_00175 [Desulfotomaculales bacterium]
MPVEFIPRRQFNMVPETLCLSCARSWPHLCAYWRLKNPERGLELMGASAVKTLARNMSRTNEETLYKVTECPHYERAKGAAAGGR